MPGMGHRMRTFVALRCGRGIVRRLREETDRLEALDRAFRGPRSDDFHLTLHFLGETDERDLGHLGRALASVAAAFPPIFVTYRGLGAFPTPARARVVWVGLTADVEPDPLVELATAVGEALGELGYPPEARAFKPHVTLGRLRGRPGEVLVEAVEAGADLRLGQEILSDLKLILSDPGDRGYRYIDLTTAKLGAADEGERRRR